MVYCLLSRHRGRLCPLAQELRSDSVGGRVREQPQHRQQQLEGPEMPVGLHSVLQRGFAPSHAQSCSRKKQFLHFHSLH